MSNLREKITKELGQLKRNQLDELSGENMMRIPNAKDLSKDELIKQIYETMKHLGMKYVPTDLDTITKKISKLQVDELQNLGEFKGLVPPDSKKYSKAQLIKLLTGDNCDADIGCKNKKELCDIEKKVCVTADMKFDYEEMKYKGHKIIGSKESLDKLKKSMEQASSKRKAEVSEFVIEDGSPIVSVKRKKQAPTPLRAKAGSSAKAAKAASTARAGAAKALTPEFEIVEDEEEEEEAPSPKRVKPVSAKQSAPPQSMGNIDLDQDFGAQFNQEPRYDPLSPTALNPQFSPEEEQEEVTQPNDMAFYALEIEANKLANVNTIVQIRKCLGLL